MDLGLWICVRVISWSLNVNSLDVNSMKFLVCGFRITIMRKTKWQPLKLPPFQLDSKTKGMSYCQEAWKLVTLLIYIFSCFMVLLNAFCLCKNVIG